MKVQFFGVVTDSDSSDFFVFVFIFSNLSVTNSSIVDNEVVCGFHQFLNLLQEL